MNRAYVFRRLTWHPSAPSSVPTVSSRCQMVSKWIRINPSQTHSVERPSKQLTNTMAKHVCRVHALANFACARKREQAEACSSWSASSAMRAAHVKRHTLGSSSNVTGSQRWVNTYMHGPRPCSVHFGHVACMGQFSPIMHTCTACVQDWASGMSSLRHWRCRPASACRCTQRMHLHSGMYAYAWTRGRVRVVRFEGGTCILWASGVLLPNHYVCLHCLSKATWVFVCVGNVLLLSRAVHTCTEQTACV